MKIKIMLFTYAFYFKNIIYFNKIFKIYLETFKNFLKIFLKINFLRKLNFTSLL